MELPECPVCMDTMTIPIYQCQSGHSLCNDCTKSLVPPLCPICRQSMTQIRNWQLEAIVAKAKVPCPNKEAGCNKMTTAENVDDHLSDCLFRRMECPLGAIFGKCSWSGKLNEMMDHFKKRHPDQTIVTNDADVELKNISINEDDRHVYLVAQFNLFFLVTMKIDTLQNMAYWAVQHFGSKKVAHQHIYEIHVTSKKDTRRRVIFSDHCYDVALKADEVFRQGKCGVLPLSVLSHFIKDRTLSFRFFIRNNNDVVGNNDNNKPPNKGLKGPVHKPKGPVHKPKGPVHKPKGPGAKPSKAKTTS